MIGNNEIDLSLFEFQKAFSTENDCLKYLSIEK